MTLRERIRYTRNIYNITQQNVADVLGVSKQYVTQIETDKLTATDKRLEEVLNAVYQAGEAKKQGRLEQVIEDLKQQKQIKKNNQE